MATNKPQGLMQRAAASLAGTGHSVFNPGNYEVRMPLGTKLPDTWTGVEITSFSLHEPTNVTRSWRVHFWPNKFLVLLPAELTREEATQAGETLMELTNMRRAGPADTGTQSRGPG